MASSAETGPVNGLVSPPTVMSTEFDTGDHHSDSDLSDVQDVVVADPDTRASAAATIEASPALDDAGHDAYASDGDDQSASTHDEASDDGDFGLDEGAPSPQSDREPDEERSPSQSSRPSPKRKSASEDTYIQQNPELYGLRRSVRCL